jgi:peptide/nickel transport system permease protein
VIQFIIRRILYMIPTILGVILITFLLFNAVGGSPASVALGKTASPRALEEFDEQRGFNKPLFMGWWTPTRAFPEWRGDAGGGGWAGVAGVPYVKESEKGWIRLEAGQRARLPLAFGLKPGGEYRLRVQARSAGGGALRLVGDTAGQSGQGVPFDGGWRRRSLPFAAPADGSVEIECRGATVEVRLLAVERRMSAFWDSQLTHFLGRLARWDLGESIATNQKVTAMLRRGIGPSLMLTVPVFAGELVLSLGLALCCAYFRDRWPDRLLVVSSVALMSVNYLVWIILGQFIFAFKLRWFPIWGFESWRHLLLPVAIGIISAMGANLRFYRTIMLDELYKDYVRTAFAKGRGPVGVLFRHVLPNAMIPVITNTVIAIPFLYTGSLLLESFFGIPGLGGMSVNAINSSDVDVVRGVVLVGAVIYVVASLVSDVCYAVADPRVKLR